MRVAEAMSRDVCVASPDQSICEAARRMAQIDAGAIPVGENDRLVGMIMSYLLVGVQQPPCLSQRDIVAGGRLKRG